MAGEAGISEFTVRRISPQIPCDTPILVNYDKTKQS